MVAEKNMKIKKRDLLVLIESYVNEQALDLELPTSDKTPASETLKICNCL